MSKRKLKRGRGSAATNLVAGSSAVSSSAKSVRLSASSELSRLSLQSVSEPKGVQFGSAPGSRQNSSAGSSGGFIPELLKVGSSGGVKSLLGGGLLGLLGGSLISGISGLFGGGAEEPAPLVSFRLPDVQSRTLDVGEPTRLPSSQSASAINPARSVYSDRNGEIVRAVKQALLTSTQLSDIISEL